MTYNRFQYNTALWNAGRDEVAGVARSIIQAHTGPHVQAVIGASGGTTLISDFIITEGEVKKPPTQYKFPDLTAFIRAYQTQAPRVDFLSIQDLITSIRGFGFKDMPACVFIVNHAPDLPASIFGLFEANLLATILGKLGEQDLPAIIQALAANLAATMLGITAPKLPATIFAQPAGNLGARIHAPADLGAIFTPVQFSDLPGAIRGFQFADLPGSMLGIAAPQLLAFLRGVAGDIRNLPAQTLPLAFNQGLPALIEPVFVGTTDFPRMPATITGATISGAEGSVNFIGGFIKGLFGGIPGELAASIRSADTEVDLQATVTGGGALNLGGTIGLIPVGAQDRFLNAFAQPLHPANLGAVLTFSENVRFLGAVILSLRGTGDLGAAIKVAETFVTALLTISTVTSRDLRATIGKPGCAGGSDVLSLGATAIAQHAKSLGALLQSFVEKNLGASINTEDLFFAYDTIVIKFTPFKLPGDPAFNATDTIAVLFSPFRGKNLGAIVNIIQNNVFLNASINPVFPLPRVVPAVNRLTALDLRLTEPQNIQEIRLQLEGSLLEYIYVNGTDTSFIKDPNEDWKINIRSFQPIAAGLFGDHAAAKVCRLGGLTSFRTMDEAVRFCIQAVLGFQSQADFGAIITSKGGINSLSAFLEPQNTFGNLPGVIQQVFQVDLSTVITGTPFLGFAVEGDFMTAAIKAVGFSPGSGIAANMGAFIDIFRELSLSGTLTTSGGQPFLANNLNAFLLNSTIGITEIKSLAATIDLEQNEQSIYFTGSGSNEYISIDTLDNLGFGLGRQFTVAFWIRWDPNSADGNPTDPAGTPVVFDSILGASSDAPAQKLLGGGIPGWKDGFGFYWEEDGASINFWVNDFETHSVVATLGSVEEFKQWIHIVGVYDADAASSNVSIYLNGTVDDTDILVADLNPVATGTTLDIGRVGFDQAADAYPNQWMDEIGIWPNVALSGGEISAIFDPGFQHHNLTVNKGAYVHADDLVVYYQFEDTAITFPTVTNVVSSDTFDGTMVGMDVSANLSNRTVVTDTNSLTFQGGGYFENSTDADLPLALNGQGSFTTVCWVRPTNFVSSDRRFLGLFHSGDQAGLEPTLSVVHDNDDGFGQRFRVLMNTPADSPINLTTDFDIDATEPYTWYHLAVTYDSNTRVCNFYVDNVFQDTGTLNAARKRTGEFTLGASRSTNNITGSRFLGDIDMNAWWDRVLTLEELDEIHNGGISEGEVDLTLLASSNDDLTSWYRLGEVPDTLLLLRSRTSKTAFTKSLSRVGPTTLTAVITDTPFNPDN